MKSRSTLIMPGIFVFSSILLLYTSEASAQIGCANENVIWQENFGSGTTVTSDPNVVSLIYQATDDLSAEGVYRIANNTQQKPEWHASTDHTGGTDGRMLVANGQAEAFYQRVITNNNGFAHGTYSFSFWAMNINTPGTCSPNPLLPVMSIIVEYLDASNVWQPIVGSPYTGAPIPRTAAPTWVNVGSYFILPVMNTAPTQIRITLSDGTVGGCGNDFAADDFKFAQCPEGGPAPVTFEGITAKQKGAGVGIDWSTSQEINNDHFEVERSADGNSGWHAIGFQTGAGNSQIAHHYNAFDAHPLTGVNYYRIKQVDRDGKSAYSKTVSVRIDGAISRVIILANPFRNNLKVQFSGVAQQVFVRLIDVTGKQVARETWNISNGESNQEFRNTSNLERGIYILSIQSKSGETLFSGKVIKQ